MLRGSEPLPPALPSLPDPSPLFPAIPKPPLLTLLFYTSVYNIPGVEF